MPFTLLLRSLRDIPGNKKCAECSDQFRDLWRANPAIGVFLCNYCANVHEKILSQPYNRVLSVDHRLDRWSDQDIRMMALWGNDRSNAYNHSYTEQKVNGRYWAANYHGKVRPQMSRSERERLVYRKYVAKEWVSQSRTWELDLMNSFMLLPEEEAVLWFTEGRRTSDDMRRKMGGIVGVGKRLTTVTDDVVLEDEHNKDAEVSAWDATIGSETGRQEHRNHDDEDSWQMAYKHSSTKYPARPFHKSNISKQRVATSPEECKVKEINGMDEQSFMCRNGLRKSSNRANHNKSKKPASDRRPRLGPRPEFQWRERVICDGRRAKPGNDKIGMEEEGGRQSSREISSSGSQPEISKARPGGHYGRLTEKKEKELLTLHKSHALPNPLSPILGKTKPAVRAESSTNFSKDLLMDVSEEENLEREKLRGFLLLDANEGGCDIKGEFWKIMGI